jgi:hypothetical protein
MTTIADFEGVWWSLPLAVVALLAIPYTIWMRRKRRRARRAAIGEPIGEPYVFEETAPIAPRRPSDDPHLWMRLVVAFVMCAGLAWLCYRVLPRAGVDVPWWVPVMCFVVILVATLVRRSGEHSGESDEEGVIGRIGPDGSGRSSSQP